MSIDGLFFSINNSLRIMDSWGNGKVGIEVYEIFGC